MTDGPALAEGLADYLAAVHRAPGPMPTLETARLIADRDAHRLSYARPAGMRVSDTYVVGTAIETPVRIYRPAGEGAQPAILYLHGGGFTTGSIESYDSLATALAEAADATVISVHYARLPEATPHAMVEQCYATLLWVARMAGVLDLDPARIALAGDSAGAFLAIHLALLARDRGGPRLLAQLLCYGAYDLDPGREDYVAQDPVLPRAVIESMIETYRRCDASADQPIPAPLGIEDLSGLPPTIMLGAELDPMLAEARDFAGRLREAGVPVEERVASGMCHGFLRAVRFSAPARAEMRWLGSTFRKHL